MFYIFADTFFIIQIKWGWIGLGDLFCLRQCNKWFLFHNLISFPCGGSLLTQWYFYALSMHIYQFLLILQDNLRKRKEACKGVPFPLRIIVLPDRLLCLVLFLMNVLKIAKQSGSIQLVHTYHTHDIGSCCCLMASCIGNDTCGNNGQITRIDHIAAL